jgi:uncharacterized protein
MGRVIHFEITADEPDRAAAFYRKAFGWAVTDWGQPERYLLATTGPEETPGINGAITGRQDHRQAVVNTVEVDSWDDGAAAVAAAGGEVLMPKTAIPGIGYFAYCRDTEGNVFGLMESDPAAQPESIPAVSGRVAG